MPRFQKQQTKSSTESNRSLIKNTENTENTENTQSNISTVNKNNIPTINKFSNVVIEDTLFMNNSDGTMIINGSTSFNGGFEVNSCGDGIAWFNTNVTISEGSNLIIGEPKTVEPSKINLG